MTSTLLEAAPVAPPTPAQQLALVVDDSSLDRRIAGGIIERVTDLKVVYANDGKEALALVEKEAPLLVLTDMQMPAVDGMELVETLRANHPGLPVILMTATGSEEAAVAAMRAGAVNYIPKRYLRQELPEVLGQVLTAARADRRRHELLSCIADYDCRFILDNDPLMVPVLVAHLQELTERIGLVSKNGKMRLGVALEEALLNGIYHGNLDVSSELKRDGGDLFHRTAVQRRWQAPYASRRLHVHVRLSPVEARFVIRDEGAGFDTSNVPDPTDPENLLRPSGRGLLLIRMFMDEVAHNATGNEVTLVKRRSA